MIDYETLLQNLKEKLSKKRYIHTLAVVKRALEYAEIYQVDKENVALTALAHDVAKELSEEEIAFYLKKYNIFLDEIEQQNERLLHQKIGAYICQYEYHFHPDMVQTVRYHTTGRADMSLLEKIIYLADATEEGRNYDMKSYVETIKRDINKGLVEVLKESIHRLVEANQVIHLDTIQCYNYYVTFQAK